ncbi:MAG: M20/M25/M40 family metallo-hydrolase [Pirellulales bacterium]
MAIAVLGILLFSNNRILRADVISAQDEMAAVATISASDAGRHIAALADDAFEGREAGTRGGRAAGAYIVDQIDQFSLEPAGDSGSFYQSFGRMRNILALVPGSDPDVAHELVILSGHYDHVGYGKASNSYGPFGFVHNGADDNASGVAAILEIAEAIQSLPVPPRRSVLLAFWDGEEKGLLGSKHFLQIRPAALEKYQIVFCINLDMIGRLRDDRLEVFGSRTAGGMRSLCTAANNHTVTKALELSYNWKISPDSDHYSFIDEKIPTLMFHTGLHENYHRPSDDIHLINLAGLEPVTQFTFRTLLRVANDPENAQPFRNGCRQESEATRRRLEAQAASIKKFRWGIGTRGDLAEPHVPVIVRVEPRSPAERGGLQVADRLLMIDNKRLIDQSDMVSRLGQIAGKVELTIERRGKIMNIAMEEDLK